MPASLYVVSTPIGNLDDITMRALSTLKSVGLIAAEDTRRTGILLRRFGISTPTTSFHEHNERQKLPQILQKLVDGTEVALVSDAGTPLVADPGQRLVAGAIAQGIRVIPIPGASAVLSALTVSGFPADEFVFAGFAPSKANARKRWLSQFSGEKRPVVFFETPHRIRKTLTDIADLLVERPIMVGRELTKLHEEVLRASTKQAAEMVVTERGEFTIVLGPISNSDVTEDTIEEQEVVSYFYHLTKLGTLTRRAALSQTAHKFGLSPKSVYSLVERWKASSAT